MTNLEPYEPPTLYARGWTVGPNTSNWGLPAGPDDFGDNMLFDPSFAADLSHWSINLGSPSWDGVEGFDGPGSLLFDHAVSGTGFFYALGDVTSTPGQLTIPVVAGQKVKLAGFVKYLGLAGSAELLIQRQNAGFGFLSNDLIASAAEVSADDSDWTLLSGEYTIPDDGTAYVIAIVVVNYSAGMIWFDRISLSLSNSPIKGVGAGLPSTVTPHSVTDMDPAVGSGGGVAADLLFTPLANFDMLPAAADGGGLAATVGLSVQDTINLADGSGGTALVPTLSIVTPLVWTDNFNRADNTTTLGTGWTNRLNNVGINGNGAYGNVNAAAAAATNDTVMTSDDMQVDITMGTWGFLGNAVYIYLGCNTSGEGTSLSIMNSAASQPAYIHSAPSGAWNPFGGGTATQRAASSSNVGYVVGDTFSFRRVGNVYTGLKNGVAIPGCTWTDSGNIIPRNSTHRLTGIGGSASSGFYTRIDSATGSIIP